MRKSVCQLRKRNFVYFSCADSSVFCATFCSGGFFIASDCLQSSIREKKSSAQKPHASAHAQLTNAPTGIAAARNNAEIIVKVICKNSMNYAPYIYYIYCNTRARAKSRKENACFCRKNKMKKNLKKIKKVQKNA